MTKGMDLLNSVKGSAGKNKNNVFLHCMVEKYGAEEGWR
jgi:hypothetical protein